MEFLRSTTHLAVAQASANAVDADSVALCEYPQRMTPRGASKSHLYIRM